MKYIICSAIVLFVIFDTNAQDSLKIKLKFDIEAKCNFLHTKKGYIHKVHIDKVSDVWGNSILPAYNHVTDNPLRHSAFYALLSSKATFLKLCQLKLDLIAEHRGMSYGINDLNNIVFFPLYLFSFNKNFNIFNDYLGVSFQFGCHTDKKIHTGLKIYNIDTQGPNFEIKWKKLNFQFQNIADLSFGNGLMLEELFDFSLGYRFSDMPKKGLNVFLNYSYNSFSPDIENYTIYNILDYSNYGIGATYSFSDKADIYFQSEIRNAPYINLQENTAFLVGANFSGNISKFSFSLNSEFRYYGWIYNYGHKNDSVSYRKNPIKQHGLYSNTVGRYLYPLKNFYRPFSQWAVYTDYQYQNIAGIEIRALLDLEVIDNLHLEADLETCTLIKEYQSKSFTYFFYKASLKYNFGKYFSIGISCTNKIMNLDKHYNTFYMSKIPYLGILLTKELNN